MLSESYDRSMLSGRSHRAVFPRGWAALPGSPPPRQLAVSAWQAVASLVGMEGSIFS